MNSFRNRLAKLERRARSRRPITAAQFAALTASAHTHGVAWEFDADFRAAFARVTQTPTAHPKILRRRIEIYLPNRERVV